MVCVLVPEELKVPSYSSRVQVLDEMTETDQQIHGAAIKRGFRGVRMNSG